MKLVILVILVLNTAIGAKLKSKTIKIQTNDFYKKNTIFTHKLDLSLILLTKSKWQKSEVIQQVRKTAKIYEKCQIKITNLTLSYMNAPYSDLEENFDRDKSNTVGYIAENSPELPKPRIFFIDKIQGYYASNAFAIAPLSLKSRQYKSINSNFFEKKLNNSAWLSSDILDFKYDKTSSYNTLAHEIGHILLNEGHIDSHWPRSKPQAESIDLFDQSLLHPNNRTHPIVYNLMISGANPSFRTGYLNRDQCRKIQKNKLIKKL